MLLLLTLIFILDDFPWMIFHGTVLSFCCHLSCIYTVYLYKLLTILHYGSGSYCYRMVTKYSYLRELLFLLRISLKCTYASRKLGFFISWKEMKVFIPDQKKLGLILKIIDFFNFLYLGEKWQILVFIFSIRLLPITYCTVYSTMYTYCTLYSR